MSREAFCGFIFVIYLICESVIGLSLFTIAC